MSTASRPASCPASRPAIRRNSPAGPARPAGGISSLARNGALPIVAPLALLILLAAAPAFASSPFFTGSSVEPSQAAIDQVTVMMQLLVPMMFAMVAIAIAVYVAGQMFGAETRARATVWAQGMIVAVGVSALLIAFIYTLLPRFFAGQISDIDIEAKLRDLNNIASGFLVALTIVLIIVAAAVYGAGMVAGGEGRARASAWSSGLIAGAIFAAVLYVILNQLLPQFGAALFPTVGGLGTNTNIYQYGGVIIQIVFFVSFFILITFLISKVFKVPEWEAYLNIEMSNLINSFLVMIFVLALFAVGTVLALQFSSGSYSSPPQAAIAYMQSTVVDSILWATIDVYKINACTSILSTFTRRIGEFVLTQTYKVFPGLDTFVSITNVLSFTLLALYNSAKVQVIMLYVTDALMVPFFLPAGIILRFFPPTRDAGAFLIALAFGFQVIFPTTYLVNARIADDVHYAAYNVPGERPAALIQSLCGPFKYGVAGFLFNPSANPVFSMIPGGQTIGNALARIFNEGLLNAISMAEFIPIMKDVAAVSLLAIFMPALSMMITIAFINAMAKFIIAKV